MSYSVDLYRQALEFAAVAHGDQKVPGKPYSYVVHLTSVCSEVIAALQGYQTANGDLAVLCALLHDTLEDTAADALELEMRFGRDVFMGVSALTKRKGLPKRQAMLDSLRRIRECSAEVGMVKLADRIVNLAPPPSGWSTTKAREYREEAGLIHSQLMSCSTCLADRLWQKMQDYERYT